ncbi:MAG: hypothetical protein KIS76_16940 [Pyrinomonadaceae bacterium]|nr:hypothetical protein [Pyrinomonadaceae bacterium]
MANEELKNRLQVLIDAGNAILNSAEIETRTEGGNRDFVLRRKIPLRTLTIKKINKTKAVSWKTSSLNCLESITSIFANSNHYDQFKTSTSNLRFESVENGVAILSSAKEDLTLNSRLHRTTSDPSNARDENVFVQLKVNCDYEAKRSSRIILLVIFLIFVLIVSLSYLFLNIYLFSLITGGVFIVSWIISSLCLQEWTPTKLPERIHEIEKGRLYKRFGADN